MKKYTYSVFLIIGILVSLSTFYIFTKSSGIVNYAFKTIQGDEKYLQGVAIKGPQSKDGWKAEIALTSSGTTSKINLAHTIGLSTLGVSPFTEDLVRLQEKHRNFMRGNKYNPLGMVEKGDLLVSVQSVVTNDGTSTFKLKVQGKEHGKTSFSHVINIPRKESQTYFSVMDAQIINDQLYILVVKVNAGIVYTDDLFLLKIDYKKGKLLEDKVLVSSGPDSQMSYAYDFVQSDYIEKHDENILFRIVKSKTITEKSGANKEEREVQFAIYHYNTGEITAVEIPKQDQAVYDLPFDNTRMENHKAEMVISGGEDNSALYLITINDNGRFSKKELKIESTKGIGPLANKVSRNGKLYLLFASDDWLYPALYVFDEATGTQLYFGKMVTTSGKSPQNQGFSVSNARLAVD